MTEINCGMTDCIRYKKRGGCKEKRITIISFPENIDDYNAPAECINYYKKSEYLCNKAERKSKKCQQALKK